MTRAQIVDRVIDRVIALRQQRGLSKADLARKSGLEQSAINQLEEQRMSPSLAKLERLAKGLGVDVAALVSPIAPEHAAELTDDEDELIYYYRALPEGDRREAKGIVKGMALPYLRRR